MLEEYIHADEILEENYKKCTVTRLTEAFSHLEIALTEIEAMDVDEEWFPKVCCHIREEMKVYLQILNEKKSSTRQSTIDSFFSNL